MKFNLIKSSYKSTHKTQFLLDITTNLITVLKQHQSQPFFCTPADRKVNQNLQSPASTLSTMYSPFIC